MKSVKSVCEIAALIVLLSVTGVATPFAGARARTVTVTNNTTYRMTEVYAAFYDSSNWSGTPNLIAGHTIEPGQTATVVINDGTKRCQYDLMAVLLGATQHAYHYQANACLGSGWQVNGM